MHGLLFVIGRLDLPWSTGSESDIASALNGEAGSIKDSRRLGLEADAGHLSCSPEDMPGRF